MQRYCVIGYPIGHSLSPKIHNKWFKKFRISARYEAREVKPADLAKFMQKFRKRYAGANVTVPHKERVIKFLDSLSPEARKIGAVNCIVNRGGKLVGYNTDAYGALAALEKAKGRRSKVKAAGKMLKGKKVVVLGAGGAARAVVYELKKAGARVTILNRTFSHAKKLARQFKCSYVIERQTQSWPKQSILDCDILINTTSVGMWPKIHKTPLPNFSQFLPLYRSTVPPPLVFDIIYRPRFTKLLRDAKKAGCQIITGDKMFLAQAAKSFELWIGKKVIYTKP